MVFSGLRGSIPIRISTDWSPPIVEWLPLPEFAFQEGTFSAGAAKIREQHGAQSSVLTSVGEMVSLANTMSESQPDGFIFHLSRSGSTLVSRMIHACRENRVLIEPAPINSLLGLAMKGYPREEISAWLSGLFRVWGLLKKNPSDRIFVKFTSWNILLIELIQAIFPAVPRLFIYRNPIEVMVSLFDSTPGWLLSMEIQNFASGLLGIGPEEVQNRSKEERCALILNGFCLAWQKHADSSSLAVDYSALPEAFFEQIAPFFNLKFSSSQERTVQHVAKYSAKSFDKETIFVDDSEHKLSMASYEMKTAAQLINLEAMIRDSN